MRSHSPILVSLIMSVGFFFLKTNAQNLVPNPGFEVYNQCPVSYNCIGPQYLLNWVMASSSPDYFNNCATNNIIDVPKNVMGFQYPHSGNGYIGLITYYSGGPNSREHIQVRLDSTLKPGRQYCVRFFINFSGDTCRFATNTFGALFTDTAVVPYSPNYSPPYLMPYTPQVEYSAGVIADTSNWLEISGVFTAQGDENFITIGSFEYDSLTNILLWDSASFEYYAYYYIDDVSVEEITPAKAGNGNTVCLGDSIQLGSNLSQNAIYSWYPTVGLSDSVAPNPKAAPQTDITYFVQKTQCNIVTTDSIKIVVKRCDSDSLPNIPTIIYSGQYFQIQSLPANSRLLLFNALGQAIFSTENYLNNILADQLSAGVYYYNLILQDQSAYKGKVCVIK
jgi:hypothetical protein